MMMIRARGAERRILKLTACFGQTDSALKEKKGLVGSTKREEEEGEKGLAMTNDFIPFENIFYYYSSRQLDKRICFYYPPPVPIQSKKGRIHVGMDNPS